MNKSAHERRLEGSLVRLLAKVKASDDACGVTGQRTWIRNARLGNGDPIWWSVASAPWDSADVESEAPGLFLVRNGEKRYELSILEVSSGRQHGSRFCAFLRTEDGVETADLRLPCYPRGETVEEAMERMSDVLAHFEMLANDEFIDARYPHAVSKKEHPSLRAFDPSAKGGDRGAREA